MGYIIKARSHVLNGSQRAHEYERELYKWQINQF